MLKKLFSIPKSAPKTDMSAMDLIKREDKQDSWRILINYHTKSAKNLKTTDGLIFPTEGKFLTIFLFQQNRFRKMS
jgi:hypothetical protein